MIRKRVKKESEKLGIRISMLMEKVYLNHTYIDGTKIEANANKYTWVWKKELRGTHLGVFFMRPTQSAE